ncbi:MAG: efflux transporter outer membrane subunit [Hyphomicrobiales bacterium]|nr:efflux transporter outer membrane subunit [Hyphomicrobiales bacterium]
MLRTWRGRQSGEVAAGLRRRIAVAAVGFCLVSLLAGCIFNERSLLGIEIPERYRAAAGVPPAAPPSLDWWRGFRSRELTALVEEAQNANFDIAVAMARIVQADAQSKIAGAALLPAADFDSSASRSRPAGGPDRSTFRIALNASYEIDFWGKNRATSRAAQETAIAARFDRDVVAISAIVAVATAYFQVLSSQERLRIARRNVEAASRVLTLIRQRQEAGTASALEVAQQETLVASQRAQIPLLDETLRQNMATLALLIGRPPAFVTVRGGSLYALAIPRVGPGLPSQLLYQRPDIRSAEATLASTDASVEAARAAFFPTIRLTGEGGFTSSALRLLFRPESAFYTLTESLTQPIFDGFRLEGQLEQAQGRQLEALNLYRRAVVSAFTDVERALISVKDSAERERLQQQVVEASRRAFEVAETRLREGTVDLVTVLITQQALFTAEENRVTARLARLQAILALYQALGGSWLPNPEVRVTQRK